MKPLKTIRKKKRLNDGGIKIQTDIGYIETMLAEITKQMNVIQGQIYLHEDSINNETIEHMLKNIEESERTLSLLLEKINELKSFRF